MAKVPHSKTLYEVYGAWVTTRRRQRKNLNKSNTLIFRMYTMPKSQKSCVIYRVKACLDIANDARDRQSKSQSKNFGFQFSCERGICMFSPKTKVMDIYPTLTIDSPLYDVFTPHRFLRIIYLN